MSLTTISIPLLLGIALFLGLIHLIYKVLNSPLRDIPGPLLARLTKLWYFVAVSKGDFDYRSIELHRQHGNIVRVAPNFYMIDDPGAAKPMLGHGSTLGKSDWYAGWAHPDPNVFNLFSDRDIKRHAETRRKVTSFYSMSSCVSYEPYVDDCEKLFATRLEELSKAGAAVDMMTWFQYYAFDVISMITLSRRMGFLDLAKDASNLIQTLNFSIKYWTLIGIFPALHPYLYPIVNKVTPTREFLRKFAADHIEERKASLGTQKKDGPMDLVTKMFHAQTEKQNITAFNIQERVVGNIIAGSDTTAIALSAILYHLIMNPDCMARLREELETNHLSDPITYKEAQDLPYLQAVIKEGLRIDPAIGLPMWRVVPRGGMTFCNRFFPEGTNVGISMWAAHRNPLIFSPSPATFSPSRWLNCHPAQKSRMDSYFLTFGMGSRTCLGINISKLEISKVIPQLLRKFDFELENPDQAVKRVDFWFTKPVGFRCLVRLRGSSSKVAV